MKTVESFEFVETTAGRESTYDWTSILDGSKKLLLKGEDFEGEVQKFVGKVRKAAAAKKLAAQVNMVKRVGKKLEVCSAKEAEGVVVQAMEANEDQLATIEKKAKQRKAKAKARRLAKKAKAETNGDETAAQS